jgi:hypothetical protein
LAGFFGLVGSLRFSSDAQALHFKVRLATGQNNSGRMIPTNPEPLSPLSGFFDGS